LNKASNCPCTRDHCQQWGLRLFRFVDAGDDESVVPELMAQPGMVLPVNIIFSDPRGQAARMLIETTDSTPALKVLS
jgi:hypothetical protein